MNPSEKQEILKRLSQLETLLTRLQRDFAMMISNERPELGGGIVLKSDLTKMLSGTRVAKDSTSTDRNVTVVNGLIEDWEV